MPENINALGGMTKEQIELYVEPIRHRVIELERAVCSNGKPSLEERMRAYVDTAVGGIRQYVDSRDEHKDRNARQMGMDLKDAIEHNGEKLELVERKQDERHEANIKRFGLLENKIAYAIGGFAVVVVLVNHFWK